MTKTFYFFFILVSSFFHFLSLFTKSVVIVKASSLTPELTHSFFLINHLFLSLVHLPPYNNNSNYPWTQIFGLWLNNVKRIRWVRKTNKKSQKYGSEEKKKNLKSFKDIWTKDALFYIRRSIIIIVKLFDQHNPCI